MSRKNQKMTRCKWCGTDSLYQSYHDHEWGVPVVDDKTMFEFFLLETFQAGLSWITILRKRENFRLAFDNFDHKVIASNNGEKIEELLSNPGIIRNKAKINAAIHNAALIPDLQREFGSLCDYFWQWVDYSPVVKEPASPAEYCATDSLSDSISKDLKKRGFKFVGSTTIYAHLQACGMVYEHEKNCFKAGGSIPKVTVTEAF